MSEQEEESIRKLEDAVDIVSIKATLWLKIYHVLIAYTVCILFVSVFCLFAGLLF